ncbi:MAG: hypothetical protein AVDCRST_MAG52-1725 [uncultured Blastococcus sp.]|uniref:Uncharacterized protein n=1 Tax=uncultured Blastococcus sp. TaxID=217144 RepID=A0A6J4I530_9ACTN|nr:MAG: hypothetical protein AVDCRST_MAG52-1725 [uncultured Blastococcus sp.]
MRHTPLERPAQHLDRPGPVTDEDPFGDGEPGDLRLAAVEPGDGVAVDGAAEVRHQLAGRRRQLPQVVADGVDESGHRVGGDPPAELADLVAGERGQVTG